MALKSVVSSFCLPKCGFLDQCDCEMFPTVKVDIEKYKKRDIWDKVFENGKNVFKNVLKATFHNFFLVHS